jgi:uncharacterized RDD family membrane protein YckC
LLKAGLMMTGLTNCPTGDDPAVPSHLCDSDAVEPALDTTAAEATASEKKLDPNFTPNFDPNSDSWRVEVAARLERYRMRRKPRTPRYPSLLLPFDAPESWSRPAPLSDSPAAGALAFAEPRQASHQSSEPGPEEQGPYRYPEQSAKVIEFPRCAAIPVFHPSDLADPVFDLDRPRIVEAAEILPPPPALGGMLMEPAQQEHADRRAGADFPLASASPSASIVRRALAALVDGVVLATSLAAFGAIFLRLNSVPELLRPLPMLAGALAGVIVLLWAVYEFLFVVYTGSTPGLRAARLRLAGFDGSPLNRRSRRWRVLASFLSAFSAGLGYLWCVLDQDGLCWHDRITRTHVQSSEHAE